MPYPTALLLFIFCLFLAITFTFASVMRVAVKQDVPSMNVYTLALGWTGVIVYLLNHNHFI